MHLVANVICYDKSSSTYAKTVEFHKHLTQLSITHLYRTQTKWRLPRLGVSRALVMRARATYMRRRDMMARAATLHELGRHYEQPSADRRRSYGGRLVAGCRYAPYSGHL
jgi:hypothetical protein